MNRRDLLKCLAAGGAVVAGELWIPGQRVISIPKVPLFGASITQHPSVRAAQAAYTDHIVDALHYCLGITAMQIDAPTPPRPAVEGRAVRGRLKPPHPAR